MKQMSNWQLFSGDFQPISRSMLQQRNTPSDDGSDTAEQPVPPRNVVHQGAMALLRQALVIIGIILIPTGVIVALLTPIIPVGLPIVILGVVLVARNASWGARLFRSILHRHPRLERFAPDWLLKLIFGETHGT